MVGIDFDSMTLEQMRDKLLEAKEILAYLNDSYHIDRAHFTNVEEDTFHGSVYFKECGFFLKCDFLPYAMGSNCLDEACNIIDDIIDCREDNLYEE